MLNAYKIEIILHDRYAHADSATFFCSLTVVFKCFG